MKKVVLFSHSTLSHRRHPDYPAVIPAGTPESRRQGWQVAGTAEARSRRRRSCPVTPRKTPAPVRCHRFAVPGRLDSGVPFGTPHPE